MSFETNVEFLVSEWLKLYRKFPRLTVVGTVLIAALIATAIYLTEQRSREQREAKRLQSFSYTKQVQTLDETKTNLQALIEFVDDEKRNLQTSQQALQLLKTEHEKMRPLLDLDRKAIDALFSAQEARNQSAQSSERWFGFGLGVASSLVASFVWAVFSYINRRRKSDSAA